jgi:hypothetical protein
MRKKRSEFPGLFDLRALEQARCNRFRASNHWRRPPLTSLWASHISPKPESMAIARIWLRFCRLNLGLLNSHSFGGCSRIGACSTTRHDELIGRLVDHVMAATPNRFDRNLDRNLA